MERETYSSMKLASYGIKKEYYPEKGYVKCPDCPKKLHCSFCVQHLRSQNPHHWVGIKLNEVPGCRGCQERYQKGIEAARSEAAWLKQKNGILEARLTSQVGDMEDVHEMADRKLPEQIAYDGVESLAEMNLKAEVEELRKDCSAGAESIVEMKMRLEVERLKETCEASDRRVSFLKRRVPNRAVASVAASFGSSWSPLLGDVTITVEGRHIHAHQLILASKSDVFREMFESGNGLALRRKVYQPWMDIGRMEMPQPATDIVRWKEYSPSTSSLPHPISEEKIQEEAPALPIHSPPPEPPKSESSPQPSPLPGPGQLQFLPSPALPSLEPESIALKFKVPSPPAPALPTPEILQENSLQKPSPPPSPETPPGIPTSAKNKLPLKKPQKKIMYPEVKVYLGPSQMLEQMGRRGVRCHLSVLGVQSLLDDSESQTEFDFPGEATESSSGGSSDGLRGEDEEDCLGSLSVSQSTGAPEPLAKDPVSSGLAREKAAYSERVPTTTTTTGTVPGALTLASQPVLQIVTPARKTTPTRRVGTSGRSGQCELHVLEVDDDTSFAVMQALIQCCYTSDVEFTDEVPAGELLKVAHKYKIGYAVDLCDRELCRRLTAENLPEMLTLGSEFGAKRLHLEATRFFRDNFDSVQEQVLGTW